MGAGGRTIRFYAPARCDALGVGRRDDNLIDDLDIERSTKVGKPARRADVVFARGRVAARVTVDQNSSGGAVLDRAPKDRAQTCVMEGIGCSVSGHLGGRRDTKKT